MPATAPSKPAEQTPRWAESISPPDAVDLLKADHREAEELFEKLNAATEGAARQSLADEVCRALTVHSLLEEELFYPACRAGGVEEDLLDDADFEHASAKELIAQIERGTPAEAHWDAKVKVLCEQIEHHVQEEEGKAGLFEQARSAGLDLDALGAEMAARRAELME